jgi:hypothetical protein
MHRLVKRVFLGVAGAALLFVAADSAVQALSLAPSIIEEQVNPGETKTISILITNDETRPLRVYPSIQKFLPLGTMGQQQFLPPSDVEGLPSWTFVGANDHVLQPGEKENLTVQIRVPTDAPQGGMYEALFFSAQPPVEEGRPSIGLRSRVGALVLLTIGKGSETELHLTDWRLLSSANEDGLRGAVHVVLKNSGRTHVVPKGNVVIRGMFGGEVVRLPLNAEGGRVLPASERGFDVVFGPVASPRTFVEGLKGELAALGFGRYTLSLEGVEGLKSVPAPLVVMVVPWRLLGVGIVGILLILGAFRWYRRRIIQALQKRTP